MLGTIVRRGAIPPSETTMTDSSFADAAPAMRRATRADVIDIVQLLIAGEVGETGVDTLDQAALPAYLKAFDAIDRDPGERLFVAEVAGRVVGTIQITFCQTLVHRGRLRATLESVHVAPDMRGRGVGAQMVAHAIAVAREHGAGIVQLTSNKLRIDAHRFYERLGFTRSHEGFKLEL
jgi:GNAT superfamily N-acetyltransferase